MCATMSHITSKIQFQNPNIPTINFRRNAASNINLPFRQTVDNYVSYPFGETVNNIHNIENAALNNENIKRIFSENGLPLRVNVKMLEKLQKGHLKDSRIIAAKIYSALPFYIKQNVNNANIQQAALLHDYGKILIPEDILNKQDKLTDEERKIIELHSELGYELLKDMGVNQEVLNLVKYHHQNPLGTGYPALNGDWEPSVESEILHAADKYSALRENRPYKPEMTKEEALSTLYEDVKAGLISEPVYNALVQSLG